MSIGTIVLVLVVALTSAGVVLYITKKSKNTQSSSDDSASIKTAIDYLDNHEIVLEAKNRAREMILEAKDKVLKIKDDLEKEISEKKSQLHTIEKENAVKKAELETWEKQLKIRESHVDEIEEAINKKKLELDEIYVAQTEKLNKIAGLTKEEAKKELLAAFDKELVEEKAKRIRAMEEEIRMNIDETAKEILVDAMRHGATDCVVEHTVSKVKLPDEEVKGRIIGKEGRNVRSFEELTGVDLDLDSTPGEVTISCFDPVRREVAKVALERLIADGRIQPAKIEEVVEATRNDIDKIILKEGQNLCHRVGAYDIPKDLVYMLGKFKYRFSYGQNMIEHTLEETRIGIALAHALGADVDTVRLGCLFHDIGKIVNDEEGTHVQLGVELLKKYNMPEKAIDCVAESHEDRPFSHIESRLVNLADHVSGSRPGARSEDYASYIKRLKDLEEIAMSFDGVAKCYAISAGREIRVFVNPEKVDDYSTSFLAREIAKKIEHNLTYPGNVKVAVIRETRSFETAK